MNKSSGVEKNNEKLKDFVAWSPLKQQLKATDQQMYGCKRSERYKVP